LVPLREKSIGKYLDHWRLMASGRYGKMKNCTDMNKHIFCKYTGLVIYIHVKDYSGLSM
jgi:hypothetical protein